MTIQTPEIIMKIKEKNHSMWKCIQVKGHLIPTGNMTPDGNKFIIRSILTQKEMTWHTSTELGPLRTYRTF